MALPFPGLINADATFMKQLSPPLLFYCYLLRLRKKDTIICLMRRPSCRTLPRGSLHQTEEVLRVTASSAGNTANVTGACN